jgi:hypothetical protein
MATLRYGHAPGHIRGAACEAFEARLRWDGRTPEPTVELERNYVPHQVPISHVCGLVWNGHRAGHIRGRCPL